MRTTIDIPDSLLDRVKTKGQREGLSVPSITKSLYQIWLDGAVSLPVTAPRPETQTTTAPRHTTYPTLEPKEWIRRADALAREIARDPADPRSLSEILMDDRNSRP